MVGVIKNTVILRYRDFEEEGYTIARHDEKIREAGATWWGWWRKDSEPENLNDLQRCQSICGSEGELKVGLFDWSVRKYHVATCNRVVLSKDPITCPNAQHVPEYYSEKKLPAWFYFKSIDEVSEEEFRRLFGGVPSGVDATMFPVVDGRIVVRDNFVLHHQDKIGPLSILHISDVHFGDDFGFPNSSKFAETSILDRLRRDISKLERSPSIVIFSGDITTRANVDSMRVTGLNFLRHLCELCGIDRQQLIIVPGNHDIPLSEVEPTDYSHESEYRAFLKDFYEVDLGSFGLHVFDHCNGERTEILAMNSVRLRNKALKNFGYLQWGLYEDNLRRANLDAQANKLAVLHHHLISVPLEEELDPEYPYASASTTIDSGSVIDGLHAHGFRYAFHGHQHVPGVFRVSRGQFTDDRTVDLSANLTVVSAGSLTSSRLGNYMRNNSYNYLCKQENGFSIRSTEYSRASAETRTNFKGNI